MDKVASNIGACSIYTGRPDNEFNVVGEARRLGLVMAESLQAAHIEEILRPLSLQDREHLVRDHQDIQLLTLPYEEVRIRTRIALRAIAQWLYLRFNLPTEGILDVGCGPTGEMVEEVLPDDVSRSACTQLDLNPQAIAENKRRHPDSEIIQGSYHDLGRSGEVNMVTGLSSLDSTAFLELAVRNIRDALTAGGYLLHVQDIAPSLYPAISELQTRGIRPPIEVEAASGGMAEFPNNLLTCRVENRMVSVAELFGNALRRALDNVGEMEILFDDWVTAETRAYFADSLRSCSGMSIRWHNSEKRTMASAWVTLARKR